MIIKFFPNQAEFLTSHVFDSNGINLVEIFHMPSPNAFAPFHLVYIYNLRQVKIHPECCYIHCQKNTYFQTRSPLCDLGFQSDEPCYPC